jgi:large subunit ribosomal protein L18
MKNACLQRRERRQRIKRHIRKKIYGTAEIPRLTVYRSLKAIYAQLIDDTSHNTLCAVSSHTKSLAGEVKKSKGKIEVARVVGTAIAEEAKKHKIKKVVFDRNGFLYHGRIKALAEAAREGGLEF